MIRTILRQQSQRVRHLHNMNYIGSKKKLLPFIDATIDDLDGINLQESVFCDLFAGSGTVGAAFKNRVATVISNDVEYFSYVLNRHRIGNTIPLHIDDIFEELNALEGVEGFIFQHYCKHAHSEREYFSADNGRKIDAIRQKIQQWYGDKRLDDNSYFYLLASLIQSCDNVANTASVYGAYLKTLKEQAKKSIVLEPMLYELSSQQHCVYNQNASELITTISGDILYLDPPYNVRQYGADYHLLNTIALYDTFEPQGKTGRREYYRSVFCKKRDAASALEYLIKKATFTYLIMSYNSDGILTSHDIEKIMKPYGNYTVVATEHKCFGRKREERSTIEYLHILQK